MDKNFSNFFFFAFGQQKVEFRPHNYISKWIHVERPWNEEKNALKIVALSLIDVDLWHFQ